MKRGAKKGVRKIRGNLDVSLIMLVALLSVFGLVMIYSTSSYNAARYYNDSTLYLRRQLIFVAVGLITMIGVSFIDYRIYIRPIKWLKNARPVWLLLALCYGLMGFVIFFGKSAGGSSRWIPLPVIGQFQPSELVKICVILVTAYSVSLIPNRMRRFKGFLRVLMYFIIMFGMVAYQNLSTAIIIASVFVVICFVASKNKGYYLIVFLIGLVFVCAFILFKGYRSERIVQWIYPENMDPGSQILQGLYAIASGGLFGKGLGNSSQKLGYIPEVHTDMIFTIICEELGIIGAILVIAVYLMVFWRLFHIAYNAPDMYGGLIATGVLTHIAVQLMMNIAVVTNSIPATGIPLPFISYGGSSLVVLMAEMGLALSVSRYTYAESVV